MIEPPRRFPPPWTADETDACFIVRDRNQAGLGIHLLRGRARPAGSDHAREIVGDALDRSEQR